MSTPMYDTPEHLPMGVDDKDRGPVDDPPHHYLCWCGDDNCIWNISLRFNYNTGYDQGYGNGTREEAAALAAYSKERNRA